MTPHAAGAMRATMVPRDARAVAMRARRGGARGGGARALGRGKDDVDARGGLNARGDDDGDDARRAEDIDAKKKEFWRVFWSTLDEQRGKAPFMKRGRVSAGVDGVASPSTRTTPTTTEARVEVAVPELGEGFWERCTIGGLVLAILMGLSAYSLTHWPTVAYAATHPSVFMFNPASADAAAQVDVVLEIIRRLAKPAVRFAATWCALRSRWRAMVVLFGASTLIPAVAFSV